jgi:hypothetical protein
VLDSMNLDIKAVTYRLHRWELGFRRFLDIIQPIFGVAEGSIGRMSSEAAKELRSRCVEEVRLYTMSIFHSCQGFDELDLSICVECVDQKEDDGYLLVE